MGDSVIAGPFPTSSLFSGTKSKTAVTAGPGGPAITLFFLKKENNDGPATAFSGRKRRANRDFFLGLIRDAAAPDWQGGFRGMAGSFFCRCFG